MIFVVAKLSCIFRYSVYAASRVTAGPIFGLLDGGGLVLPEVGGWRKTEGMLTGLGGWLLRILAAVPRAEEDGRGGGRGGL